MTYCLADDLTGALEAGALFAATGRKARVYTSNPVSCGDLVNVTVLDTETRHLAPQAAADRVRQFASSIPVQPEDLIYKKTDSTLRGHIGREIAALQAIFPQRELLYVPAYPALGRTVKNGCLFIDGTPVDETEFGRDALNPVASCRVADCLKPAAGTILDGETEEDVRAAAARILESPNRYLVAGPAAIARHLAELSKPLDIATDGNWSLRRMLVVNGSRSATSLRQVEHARANGCFRNTGWTEFTFAGQESGLARALRAGEEVASLLQRESFDGILVFGGDTAFGIYKAVGCQWLEPIGELLPGVPVSRSPDGLLWVTKAGGFGPVDLIVRLMQILFPST